MPHPLEITANDAEKVYDGTPLTLTARDFTLTGGSDVPATDTILVTCRGEQACAGESASRINTVTVFHKPDMTDVTSSYTVSTVDGLLKVTPVTTGFSCPATLSIVLNEGDYDTIVPQSLLNPATHSHTTNGVALVENNLDSQNPLTVGAHTITWTLYDTCHTPMTTCEQTVEVVFTPCEGVTYHNYQYDAVRIGNQCWLTENLRTSVDADGVAIADYATYKDMTDNLGKFGYLYSCYSAVGTPEGDDATAPQTNIGNNGQPYVQGICPPGWAVPSVADYNELQSFVGDAVLLKDASLEYWLPEAAGTLPNSGFNSRGGGKFNSAIGRYEGILSDYFGWTNDHCDGNTNKAMSVNISYYCSTFLINSASKTDRRSVRCIRKVAP